MNRSLIFLGPKSRDDAEIPSKISIKNVTTTYKYIAPARTKANKSLRKNARIFTQD